jgi:hypothetical protein
MEAVVPHSLPASLAAAPLLGSLPPRNLDRVAVAPSAGRARSHKKTAYRPCPRPALSLRTPTCPLLPPVRWTGAGPVRRRSSARWTGSALPRVWLRFFTKCSSVMINTSYTSYGRGRPVLCLLPSAVRCISSLGLLGVVEDGKKFSLMALEVTIRYEI